MRPLAYGELREWLAAKVDVNVPDVTPTPVPEASASSEYDPYVMAFP